MRFPKRKYFNKKKTRKHNKSGELLVNVFVRVEKKLLTSAKAFARENETSLSELVENYFRVIRDRDKFPGLEYPGTQMFKGALRSSRRTRRDYLNYLKKKYD